MIIHKICISMFIVLTIMSAACQQDEVGLAALNGTWIEVEDQSDTLIFNDNKYFLLNRGKEARNGHLLPKTGSGIYEFQLQADSIALYNTLSSCYCFNRYYFNLEGGTMLISDFYQKNTSGGKTLTFKKTD